MIRINECIFNVFGLLIFRTNVNILRSLLKRKTKLVLTFTAGYLQQVPCYKLKISRLKDQSTSECTKMTAYMIEIGVRSADLNPSDEVQTCFGPSSSAMGLEISGPVHLLLRIFSCVQWAYSQQVWAKKKILRKHPFQTCFLGSTSKALFGMF